MADDTLNAEIKTLVEFRTPDVAAWLTFVRAQRTEVIIGAIQSWQANPGGTSQVGFDPLAPRREAARCIVEERLAERLSRSAAWLTGVGLLLAAVGAGAGIIQALGALHKL